MYSLHNPSCFLCWIFILHATYNVLAASYSTFICDAVCILMCLFYESFFIVKILYMQLMGDGLGECIHDALLIEGKGTMTECACTLTVKTYWICSKNEIVISSWMEHKKHVLQERLYCSRCCTIMKFSLYVEGMKKKN